MMDRILAIAILKYLSLGGKFWTNETTLRRLISGELDSVVPENDMILNLDAMREKGWVDYHFDEFGSKEWRITEPGRITLADAM